jgi:hypothetical protein
MWEINSHLPDMNTGTYEYERRILDAEARKNLTLGNLFHSINYGGGSDDASDRALERIHGKDWLDAERTGEPDRDRPGHDITLDDGTA